MVSYLQQTLAISMMDAAKVCEIWFVRLKLKYKTPTYENCKKKFFCCYTEFLLREYTALLLTFAGVSFFFAQRVQQITFVENLFEVFEVRSETWSRIPSRLCKIRCLDTQRKENPPLWKTQWLMLWVHSTIILGLNLLMLARQWYTTT